MNDDLVRRWNDTVSPSSVVLHLGDVALGPIEESIALTVRLNGRKLLVPGNHDRVSPATQSKRAIERFLPMYEAAGWEILPECIEGTRRGYRIIASHYPYNGDSQEQDRHTSHRPRWTTASRSSTGTPTRGTMARTGISSTRASTLTTSR